MFGKRTFSLKFCLKTKHNLTENFKKSDKPESLKTEHRGKTVNKNNLHFNKKNFWETNFFS